MQTEVVVGFSGENDWLCTTCAHARQHCRTRPPRCVVSGVSAQGLLLLGQLPGGPQLGSGLADLPR